MEELHTTKKESRMLRKGPGLLYHPILTLTLSNSQLNPALLTCLLPVCHTGLLFNQLIWISIPGYLSSLILHVLIYKMEMFVCHICCKSQMRLHRVISVIDLVLINNYYFIVFIHYYNSISLIFYSIHFI